MHGQNMASEFGVTLALCSPLPVLSDCGSMLWCASASFRFGRSSLLDAAFRSPTATTDLATNLRGRVKAPDLHLRNDSKISAWPVRSCTPAPASTFCSPCEARSTCATRCQVRSQNSSSVLKNLLPFGTSRSLWLVAPNLISNEEACPCESPDFPSLPTALETISHLLSAADHRSGSATSRQAHCPPQSNTSFF
jgi:hypothetical protein